jgi:hypothetical protein
VKSKPDDVREAEAIIKDLKAVMAHALAGNLEVVARVRDLVGALVSDPPKVGDVVRDPRDLVNRWLDFNISSLRILTEHSIEALNGIISVAEANLDLSPNRSSTSFTSRSVAQRGDAVDLRLEGTRGSRATASFLLENFYNQPLEVTFEAEPLLAPGFPPIPASAIEIEPEIVHLPPRGRQVITVSIALDDAFASGVEYEGKVRIVGFEARMLHLIVRVIESNVEDRGNGPSKRRRRRVSRSG